METAHKTQFHPVYKHTLVIPKGFDGLLKHLFICGHHEIYKVKSEHIKGMDNRLINYLSGEIYSNILYNFVD